MKEILTPEPDDHLSEALAAYLQGIDNGNPVDHERLLAEHPESATALLAFIEGEKQIDSLSYLITPMLKKHQESDRIEISGAVRFDETPHNKSTSPIDHLAPTVDANATDELGEPADPSSIPEDYEVVKRIAHGGMGIVYKARQRSLNRIVALKVIRADKHAGEPTNKRFHAEAKAAARLKHPHIVAIHDYGVQAGQPYYSMEYIEGTSLSGLIREKPLSAREAAQYLETIARAMDYAHSEQVLHRDLKPANILVDNDHVPYVTDFGVAKRVDLDSDLTATGEVLGTPSYMSPEQTFGLPLGPTCDVYSLGAILYALLTARPPFQSDTAMDTMIQVRGVEPVSPRLVNPTVPADLDTICLKCLEKSHLKRYRTASQLADDLRRFLDGDPIQARPVGKLEKAKRWCQRNRLVAALILMVAASLIGGSALSSVMYVRESEALANSEETLSRMYLKQANLDDPANMMQTLPWLAAALRLDETNPKREPVSRVRIASALHSCASLEQMWFHDAGSEFSTFSPDGKSILTVSGDKTARVWDAATGKPLTEPLVHTGGVQHGAFNHTGKYVATACYDGIACVWDISTGETVSTLQHGMIPKQPNLPASVYRVRFLPPDPHNPEQLIVATASFDYTARVWNARTGEELAQLKHDDDVRDVLFDPTGRLLVTASYDGKARVWNWNSSADEESKQPLILAHDRKELLVESLAISPDGRRVITGTDRGNIRIWDTDSGDQLTEEPLKHVGIIEAIACSPDGEYMATASNKGPNNKTGTARVWSLLTGQLVMEIPFEYSDRAVSVAFTPDSRQLATGSWDGTVDLWDVPTGDRSVPTITHTSQIHHVEFASDEDSRAQLLTSCDDGTIRLWRMPTQPFRAELPHREVIHTFAKAAETDRFLLASQESEDSISICDLEADGTLSIQNVPVFREDIGHRDSITCADISANGRHVATGGHDKLAIVWDLATSQPVTPPLEHAFQIQQVEFSQNDRYLLVVDHDFKGNRNATCWEIDSPDEPRWTTSGNFQHAAISPDESFVALANSESILLLEARSGKTIETDIRHEGNILSSQFSPDGNLLFTGSYDGTARLWQIPSGKPHGQPMAHFGNVVAAAFDQTGERLATSSQDGTARVWETATGEPLSQRLQHNPNEHRTGVSPNNLSFSADGRSLLTVGTKPDIASLWSTVSGELAIPHSLSSGDIKAADHSHEGNGLITLHEQKINKQTQLWLQFNPIPKNERSLGELEVTTQLYSSRRIDELSDLVPCTANELRALWTTANNND